MSNIQCFVSGPLPARTWQVVKAAVAGLLAAGGIFVSASCADASTITRSVTFSLNSFVPFVGNDPVPTDPVTGSFIITLDPSLDYFDSTSGISFVSLNITLGSALSFFYSHSLDSLIVGGLQSGAGGVLADPATDDFWVEIDNLISSPLFNQALYSQTAVSPKNAFSTQTGSLTVEPV